MEGDYTIAMMTAITALLGPLGIFLYKWWERSDQQHDKSLSWKEKQETSLFDRQDRQLERAYLRIKELEQDVETLGEERVKTLGLAIRWYTRAARLHLHLMVLSSKVPGSVIPPLPDFDDKDASDANTLV